MLQFDDLAAGHPYAREITISREGRADNITTTGIVRLGADFNAGDQAGVTAEYQARLPVAIDIAEFDVLTIEGASYQVIGSPHKQPDQGSVKVELQEAASDE